MIIYSSDPHDHFVKVPNETVRDQRLSYAARGALCEMLSHSSGFATNSEVMAALARRHRGARGEGRRTMQAIYAELVECGYLVRTRSRTARGRIVTTLHLFDRPFEGDPALLTGDHPCGMSVRPGQMQVSAGRTDVPPTDMSVSGTSNRRPTKKNHNQEDEPPLVNLRPNVQEVEGPGEMEKFNLSSRNGTELERQRQADRLRKWERDSGWTPSLAPTGTDG